MLKKVRDYMREHEMTAPGDAVIVALSGGADSVCLLTVLKQLATPEFLLRAVHVHHGIRGAEADRDEAFAQKLCESLSVPLCVAYCHVPAYAAEHGLSEEEAGRILRYQVLEKEAGKWEQELPAGSRVKIALAHHRDDNAETILHHLLRGSGLTGLAGIRPVQGRRIRPLLCVGREEIRAYLEAGHISWCEDSTNQSPDYTRNRIRSQVLPLLKTAVNEQAEEHILQAGQIIGQADAYLRQQAEEIWQEAVCGREEDLAAIPLTAFARQPEILKTYLIRHMLDQLHPGWKDIGSRHFTAIAELAGKPVGSRLDLPGGLMARTGYETLEIVRKTEREVSVKTESGADGEIHGCQTVPELHMTVFPRQKDQEIPKNQYTKWFDYDKIKGTLSVRTRRTGDYLILPSGGSKTIARYMIDEKIPKEKREQILLLAEGSHVLWVVGFRISALETACSTAGLIAGVTPEKKKISMPESRASQSNSVALAFARALPARS